MGFRTYNALIMIADYSYYMLESIYHILRLIIPSTEKQHNRTYRRKYNQEIYELCTKTMSYKQITFRSSMRFALYSPYHEHGRDRSPSAHTLWDERYAIYLHFYTHYGP